MRVFSYLILVSLLFSGFTPNINEFVLINTKTFSVKGSTSIGSFDCDYNLSTKDTLFLNQKKGLSYKLPVKEFGCGNFLLTRDFRKTLKEKEYPWVYITLSDVKKTGNTFQYNLELNLAGKKKTYSNLKLNPEKGGLKGGVDLKFSDFDLKPPQKLGGAIKVKEDVSISILLRNL